ncbi:MULTISPECIES: insulinase family protein [Halomonadaceae]|uniref:insulinase family protein n=1 Tax=Halomonadaceae TaxID=28256 RepID=UPI00159B12E7|nr:MULTISPECIES: insulinase family protein [Halomonas]QJQ94572.1 hypothetical protein HIO72_04265 [Halomonas sp. PA5]
MSKVEAPGLPRESRYAIRELENGLNVMAVEVPSARKLRLVGAVDAGFFDEPAKCRGLAHLLEHALFLGSLPHSEPGELARWVGERGGRYNARTEAYTTHVHLYLPPECADEGLARLVALLYRPLLDSSLIAAEVKVLDAEFHARLADPALHRLAALGRFSEPSHPARHCHAGHRASLGEDAGQLSARLGEFHRRHYHAERMGLVMLGPQTLDEQLALLARHGACIGKATTSPPTRQPYWREAQLGAWVRWCTPPIGDSKSDNSHSLELLWALPTELVLRHGGWIEHLLGILNDGTLSANLAASLSVQLHNRASLQELEATLSWQGPQALFGITLDLEGSVEQDAMTALYTTCLACLQAALKALNEQDPPPLASPVDLDEWPREQACRLAQGIPLSTSVAAPCEPLHEARKALAHWLAPRRCRMLERCSPGTLGQRADGDTEETGTPFRFSPLPVFDEPPPLALRSAPRFMPMQPDAITPQPPEAKRHGIPQRLTSREHLALWWGGFVTSQMDDAMDTYCCLGWPAPPIHQHERLMRWRASTLALAQAARARGMTLRLGGDSQGDWLMTHGSTAPLLSLAEQAVAAWHDLPLADNAPSQPSPTAGLVAQRMLARLETPSPALRQAHSSALSCWIGEHIGSDQAHLWAERVRVLLPDIEPMRLRGDPANSREPQLSLPPVGKDWALLLEVQGADESSRSRWLMQLLGQCHDAAFYREMRQRRGLGYVAAVRYREAAGWPRLGYVVQSPHADIDALRAAIEAFLNAQALRLARLTFDEFNCLRRGLLARQGPPETIAEALERTWQALRRHSREKPLDTLPPWEEEQIALERLMPSDIEAHAQALVAGTLPRRWWEQRPTTP